MTRLACAALALLAAGAARAAPVPAAAGDPPTATAQAQPLGQLLEDAKAFVRAVGGDDAVKTMEKAIEDKLGEKGFTGLDLLRPVAGYAYLAAPIEKSRVVVAVPVTDEKDFLDLLRRLDLAAEEVKGQPGLYRRASKGNLVEFPFALRFRDRYAYLAVNSFNSDDFEAALEPKKLLPVGRLINPAERAPLAARLDLTRLDPALKKQALEVIDLGLKGLDAGVTSGVLPPWMGLVAKPALGVVRRYAEAAAADGERITARVRLDPKITETAYEVALRPKPGTKLAAEIAARKPTTNRFAGVFPQTAVGGAVVQLPLFTEDLREGFGKAAEQLLKAAEAEAGDGLGPVFEALREGAARTIKARELDAGAAVVGPGQGGLYTAVAAVSFDDPSAVEKALRAAAGKLPKPLQGAVKFDAAKAGGLSVHTAAVGGLLPPEVQKVFGEGATLYVAFAPKAVYAALGPDGLAELARVAALKPGPARAADLEVNPARLRELLKPVSAEAAEAVGVAFPKVDRLVPYTYLEVRGGDELVIRYGDRTAAAGVFFFRSVR